MVQKNHRISDGVLVGHFFIRVQLIKIVKIRLQPIFRQKATQLLNRSFCLEISLSDAILIRSFLALGYFLLKKKEAENQNQDVTCEEDLLKAKAEKRYVSRRRSSAFNKSGKSDGSRASEQDQKQTV